MSTEQTNAIAEGSQELSNINMPSPQPEKASTATESGEEKSSVPEEKDGSEMTAAAALTSLVVSVSPTEQQANDEDAEDDEEDKEFSIPQRYTKSGRKRAVSFVLKVSFSVLLAYFYLKVLN